MPFKSDPNGQWRSSHELSSLFHSGYSAITRQQCLRSLSRASVTILGVWLQELQQAAAIAGKSTGQSYLAVRCCWPPLCIAQMPRHWTAEVRSKETTGSGGIVTRNIDLRKQHINRTARTVAVIKCNTMPLNVYKHGSMDNCRTYLSHNAALDRDDCWPIHVHEANGFCSIVVNPPWGKG